MAVSCILFFSLLFLGRGINAQYSATYLPSNAPPTTEDGQAGTNQCGTALNQTSECQNAYSELNIGIEPSIHTLTNEHLQLKVNSVTDFCIFGPPDPGPDSVIGNTEVVVEPVFEEYFLILALNFSANRSCLVYPSESDRTLI